MPRQKKETSAAVLGFEDKLWQAAVLMRGKLPATQYRQVLMGLLFLRYVADAFEKRYGELKVEGYGDEEDRDAYLEKNIFFVPKEARWERIAAVAHKPENGQTIVATGSFVMTLCQATSRRDTLLHQMREMGACLGMLPYRSEEETEELYLKIKTRREKAECKDDVIFEVLDAMSYNKACKTLGATERWRISPWQKFFGWWLPIPYTVNAEKDRKNDYED